MTHTLELGDRVYYYSKRAQSIVTDCLGTVTIVNVGEWEGTHQVEWDDNRVEVLQEDELVHEPDAQPGPFFTDVHMALMDMTPEGHDYSRVFDVPAITRHLMVLAYARGKSLAELEDEEIYAVYMEHTTKLYRPCDLSRFSPRWQAKIMRLAKTRDDDEPKWDELPAVLQNFKVHCAMAALSEFETGSSYRV